MMAVSPRPLSGSIYQVVRRSRSVGALGVFAALGLGVLSVSAVTENDLSTTFAAGSNGYQSFVPTTAQNLLAGPGVLLTASQAPNTEITTSQTYAILVDGSFGLVPNTGGGGLGEVSITSNTTLTYDLGVNGYNLSDVDIFSGWGDGGRFKPTVTVRYTTTDNPFTWTQLAAVNYTAATGNSTFVNLNSLGLGSTAVTRVQFVFGAQQNGYVGYTELAVLGTAAALTGDVWTGAAGSDWGTGGSWQANAVPTPGGKVNFGVAGSTGTVDLGTSGRTVNALSFQSNIPTTVGSTAANTLTLNNGASSALITVAGTHSITAPVSLASDAAFNMVAGGQLTIGGNISETAKRNLLVGGIGKLVLTGNNSYTGITTLQDAVVNVSSLANYGQASSLGNRAADAAGGDVGLLFRGGTLQYTGSTAQTTNREIRINADGGGGLTGGATLDASGSNPAATVSFTATSSHDFFENGGNRTLTLAGSNTGLNVFAGNLSQTGGTTNLVKTGAGTWQLTNTGSTYGGITTIQGGILNFASIGNVGQASSLGNRTAEAGTGAVGLLFRGGTLQYTGSTAQTTDRAIRINADGGANPGGGTIDASGSVPSATLSFTRASSPDFFEVAGNRTLTLTGSNTGNNTFAMIIPQTGGATSVVKNGVGTWVLTGASTYSGGTTVNNGTLALGFGAGGRGALNPGSPVTVAAGATLQLNVTDAYGVYAQSPAPANVSGTILSGAGLHTTLPGITLNGGTVASAGAGDGVGSSNFIFDGTITTLASANTANITAAGIALRGQFNGGANGPVSFNIADGAAAVDLNVTSVVFTDTNSGLTKTGAGRMKLSGLDTYTGQTLVSAGTLAAGSSSALGTSAVHVAGGATLDVSDLAVGSLGIGGALALDSTSTLTLGLSKSGAHSGVQPDLTDYTRLTLASGGMIDGSNLSLSLSNGIQQGDIFRIIASGTAVTGTFAGLPSFSTFTVGTQGFEINYAYNAAGSFTDTNGTDVALRAIPEPASVALLIGSIGILAGVRRRSRKA
jgi:autotransporter-associated beta strand protein